MDSMEDWLRLDVEFFGADTVSLEGNPFCRLWRELKKEWGRLVYRGGDRKCNLCRDSCSSDCQMLRIAVIWRCRNVG